MIISSILDKNLQWKIMVNHDFNFIKHICSYPISLLSSHKLISSYLSINIKSSHQPGPIGKLPCHCRLLMAAPFCVARVFSPTYPHPDRQRGEKGRGNDPRVVGWHPSQPSWLVAIISALSYYAMLFTPLSGSTPPVSASTRLVQSTRRKSTRG